MTLSDDNGLPIGSICDCAAKAFSSVFLCHLPDIIARTEVCNHKARCGRQFASAFMIGNGGSVSKGSKPPFAAKATKVHLGPIMSFDPNGGNRTFAALWIEVRNADLAPFRFRCAKGRY